MNGRYLAATTLASDVTGSFGSISQVLRMLLQSAMLGLGAWLVIQQELTAGAMIAASIMMGRALAPIEIAIANWRSLAAAHQSLVRLTRTLARLPAQREVTSSAQPRAQPDGAACHGDSAGPASCVLDVALRTFRRDRRWRIIGASGAGNRRGADH